MCVKFPIQELEFESFLTTNLLKRDNLQILFGVLCRNLRYCTPERLGFGERYKLPFCCDDELLTLSQIPTDATGFFWKSRNPRSHGSVFKGGGPSKFYDSINMSCKASKLAAIDLIGLCRDCCLALDTVLSVVHQLQKTEIDRHQRTYGFEGSNNLRLEDPVHPGVQMILCHDKKRQEWSFGLSTDLLRHFLPDLYWLNVFGPPYVKLIGKETLLSAPAYRVEEIGNGAILVQLTEDLLEIGNDFEAFDRTRQRVKRHLDDNIFFDPKNDWSHVYRTPVLPPEYTAPPHDYEAENRERRELREAAKQQLEMELKSLEYVDEAIGELAQMFMVLKLPGRFLKGLDQASLDYSIQSLDEVERWLTSLRGMRVSDENYMKMVLRSGAYLGEVTRRANESQNLRWIDYATANSLKPEFYTPLEGELGVAAVLCNVAEEIYLHPLAKVEKHLANGEGGLKEFTSLPSW